MMNLADMLCYADIHQLKRIADKYGCECRGHSKHELIQSILSKVHRREVVDRLISELKAEDLRFLSTFLFDARDVFSPEELMARARQARFEDGKAADGEEPFSPRHLINEYRSRGWLFNGMGKENRYLLQFPRDLKEKFSAILMKRMAESLEYSAEPHVYRDERGLIGEDILHFLRFLSREHVPLTAAGFMYKRQLQQLLASFSVEEPLPAKAAWRFGYGRRFKEYPERFSFIYDFCYYHGWIVEQEDRLELSPEGTAVLERNSPISAVETYRFWLRLYKGPIHNIQTIAHWVEGLAKRWVSVRSLVKALLTYVKPYYYDDAESVLVKRVLMMMMHLGLIAYGEEQEVGPVIRMHDLGSEIIKGTYVEEDDRIEIPISEQ